MLTSQNGYSANDRSVIASYTVPGTALRIALRKGDASVVLLDYLARYNREVEPLSHDPQDLWGYAERTIRGESTTLSNHSSGTAVDTRATRHPLGSVGTFTADELDDLNALLADYNGVIRHGKDYIGRKDPMHAELVGTPTQIKRVADRIRSRSDSAVSLAPTPPPEDDLRDDERAWLGTIYDQVTGRNFQGWPTFEGGTNESLTLVDYARRDNAEVRGLHQKLDDLAARLSSLESGPPATNITAAQVVDALLARLKEAP